MRGDRTGASYYADVAAKIRDLLPNGGLATLEGLDHMAPWVAPGVVAQRTMEFIDRCEAAGM